MAAHTIQVDNDLEWGPAMCVRNNGKIDACQIHTRENRVTKVNATEKELKESTAHNIRADNDFE